MRKRYRTKQPATQCPHPRNTRSYHEWRYEIGEQADGLIEEGTSWAAIREELKVSGTMLAAALRDYRKQRDAQGAYFAAQELLK